MKEPILIRCPKHPEKVFFTHKEGTECKDLVCFLQPLFGKSCKVKMDNCACPKRTMLQTGFPASHDTGRIPLQTGYRCYR